MIPATSVRVGRLRVRGAGAGAPALRESIARRIERADLAPRSLPPAAILVVRKVVAARVRTAPRRRSGAVAGSWHQTLRSRLDDVCRTCARPVGGEVPLDADAVLFADEAELFACLALDVARGRQRERWWWRTLLAADELDLAALLLRQARHLPAVLGTLEAWGCLAEVIAPRKPGEIAALAAAVVREHGLDPALAADPLWRDASGPETPRYSEPPIALAPQAPPAGRQSEPVRATSVAPMAPWRGWIAASLLADLSPAAQALVGFCLTLRRAPHRARAPLFTVQVRAWSQTVRADPRLAAPGIREAAPVPEEPRPPPPATAVVRDPCTPTHASDAIAGDAEDLLAVGAPRPTLPECAVPGGVAPWPIPAEPPSGDILSTPEDRRATTDAPPAGRIARLADGEAAAEDPGLPKRAAPATALEAERAELAGGIETRLAGILYLINLFEFLDLPTCFEPDWRLGEQLGPWALLELIGRALLAQVLEEDAQDPIWRALAMLDGRAPDTLPGTDFRGGEAYRLPVVWARSVATDGERFRWRVAGGRLRLWSEAGYVVAELPRNGAPAAGQAQDELAARLGVPADAPTATEAASYQPSPVAPLRNLRRRRLNAALVRWLGLATPCISRRLELALGVPEPVAHLLYLPGRIHVTSSHIDLVADLARVSLAVRRSGLDRDPGWAPRFGRVVLFHFQ